MTERGVITRLTVTSSALRAAALSRSSVRGDRERGRSQRARSRARERVDYETAGRARRTSCVADAFRRAVLDRSSPDFSITVTASRKSAGPSASSHTASSSGFTQVRKCLSPFEGGRGCSGQYEVARNRKKMPTCWLVFGFQT
jgi:hypothetical protein